MKRPFRDHHLLQALQEFEEATLPLDAHLSYYFRRHKAVGSKDRKQIAEMAYTIVRQKGLLDYFCEKPTWDKRIEAMQESSLDRARQDLSIPEHIRASFPKNYYEQIKKHYGEKTFDLALLLNERAPTTVRVNPLVISRDELFNQWKSLYEVTLTEVSPYGITFKEKINFFSLGEFKKGSFEIQDEGSQCLALLVDAQPGDKILDYCAGAGGKTLAFAPFMKGTGQIFLHDIRKRALLEAKKRLKRAGIQNCQLLFQDSRQKNALKGKMDRILLDVPCSGSGTLRRNPDMKWRYTDTMLSSLVEEQRNIVRDALTFAKKGAKIVYATCSIFPEENEEQITYFCKHFPLKLLSVKSWLPKPNGMDGFFGAILEVI